MSDMEEKCDVVLGVRAMLEQDLLPSFIPIFCAGFMKNVSKRAIQRIVEDIRTFTEKFNNGCPLEELLQPVKGKQHESEPEQEPKMSLSDPVE